MTDETDDDMFSDDTQNLFDDVQAQREQWEAEMMDKHGCLPPKTYDKELGHEIVLNPNNERYPNHAEDRDDIVTAAVRQATDLAVFLPRPSGTCWRIQSDGMMMSHPVLEGTMIPVQTYQSNPQLLPEGNYLGGADEAEMRDIWNAIEHDLSITVEDTAPTDGYGQAQEAIRWVELVDHDAYREPYHGEPYIPDYKDWVRWAEETQSPFALIYRNCD